VGPHERAALRKPCDDDVEETPDRECRREHESGEGKLHPPSIGRSDYPL
jgi:hypothetical protein